jgi:hypothetical protein
VASKEFLGDSPALGFVRAMVFIPSTSPRIQPRVRGSRGTAEGLIVGVVAEVTGAVEPLEGGGKTVLDVLIGAL